MTSLPLATGVLIALAAATGSWDVLNSLGSTIVLTKSVFDELKKGKTGNPGTDIPLASCMSIWPEEVSSPSWLTSVLDKGEASVIALALSQNWPEVGIDEAIGRSIAKKCNLRLTGSLGLLIRAKRTDPTISISAAISNIRSAGVWIGLDVERAALRLAGEIMEV